MIATRCRIFRLSARRPRSITIDDYETMNFLRIMDVRVEKGFQATGDVTDRLVGVIRYTLSFPPLLSAGRPRVGRSLENVLTRADEFLRGMQISHFRSREIVCFDSRWYIISYKVRCFIKRFFVIYRFNLTSNTLINRMLRVNERFDKICNIVEHSSSASNSRTSFRDI